MFTDGTDAPLLRIPPGLETPPHVTAQPAITHRKFSFPSSFEEALTVSSDSKEPQLRFIVLATGGLWDELSSREVVSLVADHLKGLRAPAISMSDLPKQFPLVYPTMLQVYM